MAFLGDETRIGQQFILELPADEDTISSTIETVEREWWKMVGRERIIVTELPITIMLERGRDLAAHLDSQLYQPYGYEPPMELVIRVEGRGCKDIRTDDQRRRTA